MTSPTGRTSATGRRAAPENGVANTSARRPRQSSSPRRRERPAPCGDRRRRVDARVRALGARPERRAEVPRAPLPSAAERVGEHGHDGIERAVRPPLHGVLRSRRPSRRRPEARHRVGGAPCRAVARSLAPATPSSARMRPGRPRGRRRRRGPRLCRRRRRRPGRAPGRRGGADGGSIALRAKSARVNSAPHRRPGRRPTLVRSAAPSRASAAG